MQYEGEVKCLKDLLQQAKATIDDARDGGSTYNDITWQLLRDVSVSDQISIPWFSTYALYVCMHYLSFVVLLYMCMFSATPLPLCSWV